MENIGKTLIPLLLHFFAPLHDAPQGEAAKERDELAGGPGADRPFFAAKELRPRGERATRGRAVPAHGADPRGTGRGEGEDDVS